jgi:hypothetical protein
LLDVDPDLGRLLDAPRREAARRDVGVRLLQVRRGLWPVERMVTGTDPRHLGLIVVDGLIARELLVDEVRSLELLGPGDVVRPWLEAVDGALLPTVVRWSALADSRLALLDRRVGERLAAYPEIHAVLLERSTTQTHRMATAQAITQVRRVDRRLLLLLWHLAERWGKVTPAGVALPLALSHRLLAELIGARRPTVSTALGELLRTGELARGSGGTWILTGAPAMAPDGDASRFVSQRRAALSAD